MVMGVIDPASGMLLHPANFAGRYICVDSCCFQGHLSPSQTSMD